MYFVKCLMFFLIELKPTNTNVLFEQKCRRCEMISALIQFQVTAGLLVEEQECQKHDSLTERCLHTDNTTTADTNIRTMVPLYCSEI